MISSARQMVFQFWFHLPHIALSGFNAIKIIDNIFARTSLVCMMHLVPKWANECHSQLKQLFRDGASRLSDIRHFMVTLMVSQVIISNLIAFFLLTIAIINTLAGQMWIEYFFMHYCLFSAIIKPFAARIWKCFKEWAFILFFGLPHSPSHVSVF